MTNATATVVACILAQFEAEKVEGQTGYDLHRNTSDVGRAFVGHYRDLRDCERVAKRTLANEEERDFVQTLGAVSVAMSGRYSPPDLGNG